MWKDMLQALEIQTGQILTNLHLVQHRQSNFLWMLVLSALARPTWMSLLTGGSCQGASIANLQFAFGCLCVYESS
jgi:hypothetical protein